MVKAIVLQCNSYAFTIGGEQDKNKIWRKMLSDNALCQIQMLAIFESETDFRDFYRKEMQFKYNFFALKSDFLQSRTMFRNKIQ